MIALGDRAASPAQCGVADDERVARSCVFAALILAVAVNLPLLVSNTIFGGDDWAWVWVYRSQGVGAIPRYMWQAAHPGYGVFLDLCFLLGGNRAGQVGHFFAVSSLLACGWMIWRIFRDARFSPSVAATFAVLYLSSPFLADLHGSLAHSFYEPVTFFYLLSIWLSLRRGTVAIAGALVAMIIGLTIETLIALEPLRWWLLYRERSNWRETAGAIAPFAALALAAVAVRVMWLTPEGIYRGYNDIAAPDGHDFARLAKQSARYFLDVREPVRFAGDLWRYDNPLLGIVLLVGAFFAGRAAWRNGTTNSSELKGLLIVGVIVLVLGTIPYITIDRFPSRFDVNSRYAVASQFGALLLAVGALQLVRFAPVRALVLASVVFVFMANQLQLGKWLLYEAPIVADFRAQVGAYLAHADDQVLLVDFVPPATDFLFNRRVCLSSYDTNVSLELAGLRRHSFVFDRACGKSIYANSAGCLLTGYDPAGPCPAEHRTATFRLNSGLVPFTRFGIAEVLRRTFQNEPVRMGVLSITLDVGRSDDH